MFNYAGIGLLVIPFASPFIPFFGVEMDIKKRVCLSALLIIAGLARAFTGGDGTPQAPYQIATRADLEAVNNDLAASYILVNDIDLAGLTYTRAIIAPDTSSNYSFQGGKFSGTFNGNGFKIINYTIDADDFVGLFGFIENGGMVSSLGIENCNISGEREVGALAGHAGTLQDFPIPTMGCTITNCYASGLIKGNLLTGGLIGYSIHGTITNCHVQGQFTECGDYTGGLVGMSTQTVVTNCYTTVDMIFDWIFRKKYVGGLIGYSRAFITGCYTAGQVLNQGNEVGGLVGHAESGEIVNSHATCIVQGGGAVGGLVGFNDRTPISDCYTTGNVSGSVAVGGLVGQNKYSLISNCRALGSVSAGSTTGGLIGLNEWASILNCCASGAVTGVEIAGGLIGYSRMQSSVMNSYATGNVSGTGSIIGGLIGWNSNNTITDCYATGDVDGIDSVGGLTGKNNGIITTSYAIGNVSGQTNTGGLSGYNTNTITNSFWDTQTSGQSTSAGGTGKTTAEMHDINTFLAASWDFLGEAANGGEEVWAMPEGGYPVLAWIADFNADGRIDYADYDMLSSQWLQSGDGLACDIYPAGIGDGIVNVDDLLMFADIWQQEIRSQELSGDFNYDYTVDTSDMFYMIDEWLGTGIKCDIAPANGDGTVDIIDFAAMAAYWVALE